jgi:hypothetical protein
MKVVIPRAVLKQNRACSAAYVSPEWDEKEDAIVFSDWDKTVQRLLAKPNGEGLDQLDWYVAHKLVPMTASEFAELKRKHGGSNG